VLFFQFLAHARGLRVELSSGAEKMIHGYYMASRRVRSDQNHGVKVSVASVKLLQVSLSTVHFLISLFFIILFNTVIVFVVHYRIVTWHKNFLRDK